ncbi:MAG: peptide ABC transporter substrate-binding protein [Planctomycetes bacterium]|nr:peptide ABC transporter substrate-binding protein [Planctomycetota bacterium]
MLRLVVIFLVLAAVLGALVGTDRPPPRADLTFLNRTDLNTLDPQLMSWQQDFRVAKLIGEGLVTSNVFSHDYSPMPAAAERWEVSPDGKTYTFHLRKTGWSDGSPVVAGDFLYAWMRGLLPDLGADYIGFLEHIRGGREFFRWRSDRLAAFASAVRESGGRPDPQAAQRLWEETREAFNRLVKAWAPDDRTIVIELVRPTPYFLDMVGFVTFHPLCESSVRRYEVLDPLTGRVTWDQGWTKPPKLICNGPFSVEYWQFKRDVRLRRNPYYWNAASIALDTISIPTVEDTVSTVMAFRTGAVDLVNDVLAPFRAEIVAQKAAFYREHQAEVDSLRSQGLDPVEIDRRLPPDPRKNVHVFPGFGTCFWNINCSPQLADGRNNPLADARVRRALAMAIDKKAIADGIRRVGEPVAGSLIPPGSLAQYTSPRGLGYDPERARKLLAEAGYPGGAGFITLDLLVTKDGGNELIAQSIAKDWQRELGIDTTITVQEVKVFRERLRSKNFMTARASWFGDYGDPTTFLEINRSGDGNNDRNYASPVFDELLEKASNEADPLKRLALLEDAERVLVEEDLPLIPLFYFVNICMFDANKLTGISSHPRGDQLLYKVDLFGDGKGSDRPLALPPRKAGEHHQGESGS